MKPSSSSSARALRARRRNSRCDSPSIETAMMTRATYASSCSSNRVEEDGGEDTTETRSYSRYAAAFDTPLTSASPMSDLRWSFNRDTTLESIENIEETVLARAESGASCTSTDSRKRRIEESEAASCSTSLLLDTNDEVIRQQIEIMKQIKDAATPEKRLKEEPSPPRERLSYTLRSPPSLRQHSPPPRPKSPPPSTGDEDFFLQCLQEPNMIEEQRRIMEEILRQRGEDCTQANSKIASDPRGSVYATATRRPVSEKVDDLEDCIEQAAHRHHTTPPTLRRSSRRITPPNLLPSGAPPAKAQASAMTHNDSILDCSEDRKINIYGNKKLRVRGTNHTWKNIAQGEATLVQCPGCSTILQVGQNAKLLYCTECNEVSPIKLQLQSSNGSSASDSRIARIVQQQEMDVAFATKAAKASRQNC